MPQLKRNLIKKRLLINLYWKQKLNLKEIGKLTSLSARTVNIRMRECKIPLRLPGVPGPKIKKEDLKRLYVNKRLSSRKIAKIYKCAYSTIDRKIRQFGLPIKTLAAAHIVTLRTSFSGNLREKAYLVGFRIGDLRVRKMYKNSETVLVDCGSTKPRQISLIKTLFSKYGRVWIGKPSKSGKVQIECSLDKSFLFLLKKYDRFPTWALKDRILFFSLLAGFTDAEGSFYVTKDKKSSGFSLGNYNKMLLKQIEGLLEKLNFTPRLFLSVRKGYRGKDGYAHRQDYWVLTIYRKVEIYKFIQIIKPFLKHKDKIQDANRVIQNINMRNAKYGYIGMEMLNFGHGQEKFLFNHNFALRQC